MCTVCAACALLLVLPLRKEPWYKGHRLSYWVRALGSVPATGSIPTTGPEGQSASEAIDHIGAAAAPFIVRWIRYEPTKWTLRQKKLADLICKRRSPLALRIGRSLYHTRGERLSAGATQAFRVLGTNAASELDELCRLMNDLSAPSTANRATYCLSWLGTNALPALTAVIQNPNPLRWQAINSIWLMELHHPDAQFPITAIIGCLEDANDPNVPITAARILGDLKVPPEVCLPALLAGLRSKSHFTREACASAFGRFGDRAASAIPALEYAMADPDPIVRFSVANALHAIAPGTYTNAPPRPPSWGEE